MDYEKRSSLDEKEEESLSGNQLETKLDAPDSKTSEISEDNQDGMQETDIEGGTQEDDRPPEKNNDSNSIKLIKRQNRILIVIVGMMILLFCIQGVLAFFVRKLLKGTSTTDDNLTAEINRFEDQHETVIEMISNLTVTLTAVIEQNNRTTAQNLAAQNLAAQNLAALSTSLAALQTCKWSEREIIS